MDVALALHSMTQGSATVCRISQDLLDFVVEVFGASNQPTGYDTVVGVPGGNRHGGDQPTDDLAQ
jgi:hypothetical protein